MRKTLGSNRGDSFYKIGDENVDIYESHHEPVSGHRSGQVARGQGHMHTRSTAVGQDGFCQVKDKTRRYILFD